MAERPTVLGVASYADRDAAVADLGAVMATHPGGELNFAAAALLVKGIDGRLQVDCHDATATHRTWGRSLVGSALAVVAAPLAFVPFGDVAAQDANLVGIGDIVGHFWNNIPKRQLLRMSDLLESRQAALVVVAVGHTAADVEALLPNAAATIVDETDGGDIERAYAEALGRDEHPS